MNDLFDSTIGGDSGGGDSGGGHGGGGHGGGARHRGREDRAAAAYTAKDIEVLEGLEPVRRRPGMFIGGTDEAGLHHLAAELIDNAMDEAVAGHASFIEVTLEQGNVLSVRDNGRGIPVDPHPKFKHLSALEVILTTLHSGGKFGGHAYSTSGGLHGVGSSIVNALSDWLEVEVARERTLWRQRYQRGKPAGKLLNAGGAPNRRGTMIRFHPDPEVFGKASFAPARLYRLCRSKAYLFRGVEIRWSAALALVAGTDVPAEAVLHFPGGLAESLAAEIAEVPRALPTLWAGEAPLPAEAGRLEWAAAWLAEDGGFLHSYCNTVPTPQGGPHEQGLRQALFRAIRAWGEQRGNRRAQQLLADDVMAPVAAELSIFLREPQFVGQTKEKLANPEAQRLVETALGDRFQHFLAADPSQADSLLGLAIDHAEERLRRREAKETARKSATRRLRLPGKLTDCTRAEREGTEIFLVEGDSAGGSAKQARDRETQAVLPLRGKVLNVASASVEKLRQNQELKDLVEALGCGVGERFDRAKLRYARIIIMTDADVDGAHIASLLMTFFYRELPGLIAHGHLYLARPPLYRLTQNAKSVYAMDDADRERRIATDFKPGAKIEISRFKGLGEMPSALLRETTMDPKRRILFRVTVAAAERTATDSLVESLMGRRPELRFQFIQEHAPAVSELDI
ncbi:MAG: DNA topoisomerase IV subunit B [Acetobacteraceae bacterium]